MITGWVSPFVVVATLSAAAAGAVAAARATPVWIRAAGLAPRSRSREVPARARRLAGATSVRSGVPLVVGLAFGGAIAALPGALLGGFGCAAGSIVVRWLRRERRIDRIDRDVGPAADLLRRELSSGATLFDALGAVGPVVGGPLGDELSTMVARYRAGVASETVLCDAARRADAASLATFCTALRLGSRLGGPISVLLGQVSSAARERREVELVARVAAAQSRISAVVVGALPIAFAVLVVLVDRRALAVLTTWPLGVTCLASGLALDALGLWWMARLVGGVR